MSTWRFSFHAISSLFAQIHSGCEGHSAWTRISACQIGGIQAYWISRTIGDVGPLPWLEGLPNTSPRETTHSLTAESAVDATEGSDVSFWAAALLEASSVADSISSSSSR